MLKKSIGTLALVGFVCAGSVFAGQPIQWACGELAVCVQSADLTAACRATDGVNVFEQNADPRGDNSCNITIKLRDQICAAGLDPQSFVVDCWNH